MRSPEMDGYRRLAQRVVLQAVRDGAWAMLGDYGMRGWIELAGLGAQTVRRVAAARTGRPRAQCAQRRSSDAQAQRTDNSFAADGDG